MKVDGPRPWGHGRTLLAGDNIDYLAAHHESYAHDESHTRKSLFGLITYGRSSSSHTPVRPPRLLEWHAV